MPRDPYTSNSADRIRSEKRRSGIAAGMADQIAMASRALSLAREAIRLGTEATVTPRSSIGAKLVKVMVLTSGAALILASVTLISMDFHATREHIVRDVKTLSSCHH